MHKDNYWNRKIISYKISKKSRGYAICTIIKLEIKSVVPSMEIYHTKRQKCRTPGTPLTFLFEREPGTGRDSFKVNSPLLLFQEAENVSWLSSRKLEVQAANKNCELDEAVKVAIAQGVMQQQSTAWIRILRQFWQKNRRKRRKESMFWRSATSEVRC